MTCARHRAASLALLAALACGRTRLTALVPHAVIDGSAIDFGPTPVLFPVERRLLVVNAGPVPLQLFSLQITGAGFELPDAVQTVPAGQTATLRLLFRPPAKGHFEGSLTLQTDDPELTSQVIALTGDGTESGALTVTPDKLDFGRVGEGQAQTRALTLRSTGAADLFLDKLGLAAGTTDAFGFVGSVATPATMPPGSTVELAVRFAPTPGSGGAQGSLAIDSSDPAHPRLLVPVQGSINHAPVAVARGGSPLQTGVVDAAVGASVQLDGTASSDADGDTPLRYAWSLAQRPAGSSAALTAPDTATPTLKTDAPGIYSVQLTVTDSTGLPSFAPARLDIRSTPAEKLVVQLIWDRLEPDLDLHFLQQGAALDSAGDCSWSNADPQWVVPGTPEQNPHHQGDKLTGYGPETVLWKEPAPGSYDLAVVYKAEHGAQPRTVNAEVRVYAQGVLVADLIKQLQQQGDVWRAGSIDWPSGKVTTP